MSIRATKKEISSFRPGLFQHWKGPFYRALFLGSDSTNRPSVGGLESSQEPMVAYVSLDADHGICFRELWQWNELVPNIGGENYSRVPRFRWISP